MFKLFALVLPLGLDTFAVSAALGMTGMTPRERLRVSALFMAFEGVMPLLGLLLGAALSGAAGRYADLVAIAVLLALGAYMLLARQGDDDEKASLLARTRGPAVLGLGLSISLDELAIGFTIGLIQAPLALAIVLITLQAFVLSQAGFRLGARVGERVREGAERAAGAALILLGLGLAAARLAGVPV